LFSTITISITMSKLNSWAIVGLVPLAMGAIVAIATPAQAMDPGEPIQPPAVRTPEPGTVIATLGAIGVATAIKRRKQKQ
jgi:hypothetical protein